MEDEVNNNEIQTHYFSSMKSITETITLVLRGPISSHIIFSSLSLDPKSIYTNLSYSLTNATDMATNS